MKTLSQILEILINNLKIEDTPVNVFVDGKLYDIKDFRYEPEIGEYVLELHGGYEYRIVKNK